MMSKFIKGVAIVLGIVLLVIIVFYLTGRSEELKLLFGDISAKLTELPRNLLAWVIGLFGVVAGILKKVFGSFGLGETGKNIAAVNERIKADQEKILGEIKETEERLKRERALHEREIKLYEQQLAGNAAERAALKKQIDLIETMGFEKWFEAQPAAGKQQIKQKIWENVQW